MTDPLYDSRNPNHGRTGGLVDQPTSQALADRLEAYAAKYSESWTSALPTISWDNLALIVAVLRALSQPSDAPEEITGAEMDAIEAAAIAGNPLTYSEATLTTKPSPRAWEWRRKGSNDEWVPCAVPGDPWQTTYEYRGLGVIERAADVRAAVIEECAKEAERLYEKPGWSPHYKNAAQTIAGFIRALSQAHVTDGVGGQS